MMIQHKSNTITASTKIMWLYIKKIVPSHSKQRKNVIIIMKMNRVWREPMKLNSLCTGFHFSFPFCVKECLWRERKKHNKHSSIIIIKWMINKKKHWLIKNEVSNCCKVADRLPYAKLKSPNLYSFFFIINIPLGFFPLLKQSDKSWIMLVLVVSYVV